MSSIFVSYSRKDSDFAYELVNRLERTYRVWLDKRGISGGADWENAIKVGIQDCAAMVVILSPDAVTSDYVRFEYETALKSDKQVIPILYRECEFPVMLRKIQIIKHADGDWFQQLQTALSENTNVVNTQDSSYLIQHGLIGDASKTFGDLAPLIHGSFVMDKHETNLVALPLSVTQHAMTYLVGQHTTSLKRPDEIQLALQCSQGYNSDDFPVQVAKHVLSTEKPLHLILVRGPMMLTQHHKFGIQMIHGLNNEDETEWRGVIGAAYKSLDAYDTGTVRRRMVHVFNIAPAALLGGFGVWSERGRGMTFYNYAAHNQYNPVFVMPAH